MDPHALFVRLGGCDFDGFPAIHSPVDQTPGGTPYLRHAGVVMIGRPQTNLEGMRGFLEGFDPSLEFPGYLDDPGEITPAARLLKAAGQACYASFGPRRTYNADTQAYFDNQKDGGHGSVLEHATFSVLCYGISRSNTHEIVRHRAGTAFSQLSQRFVDGRVLRFVERPEYAAVPTLHKRFCERIDSAAREYQEVAEDLIAAQSQSASILSGTGEADERRRARDLRKKVNQAARSVLPNETETFMVLSANVRAWRHMIEMRTDPHAETEIRDLYIRIFLCLRQVEPALFHDYELASLPDGTFGVSTRWRKV